MATGGWRISQFSVRVGDYVRFMEHNIQRRFSDEWWKVTSIDGTLINLVNHDGATSRIRPTRATRVYRHPYSQNKAS